MNLKGAFKELFEDTTKRIFMAIMDPFHLTSRQQGHRIMYNHETTLRVRYGETDQMGYVYYGDYAEYFEVGRVEALRSLGFPYRRLEEEGVMLPVREMKVRYHLAARYDDLITLRTYIDELPGVRITFRYELFNEAGELLTEATTTLVFVRAGTMRPCRAPQPLLDVLSAHFE